MESRLKFFSFGIVAKSKEINDKKILAYPTEHLGAASGEINSDVDDSVLSGKNALGEKYSISAKTTNAIKAEWFDLSGSNRVTAPDVVVGEPVLLMRYSRSEKIYWVSLGTYPRRLETIISRVSNNRDPSVTELNDDNSYWYKMSTHEKVFVFKTSNNDGEAAWFQISLDLKEGVASVLDDNNNRIYIDRPNTIIEMINADETRVRLDKTNLSIFAKDKIDIETTDLTVNAKTIKTTADSHEENIKSIVTSGNSMTVNMSNITFKATFSVTGDTTISGNFGATGDTFAHKGVNVGYQHTHDGGTIDGKTLFPIPS